MLPVRATGGGDVHRVLLQVTDCTAVIWMGDNDYSSIRAKVNRELLNGYFGPSKGGVYSVSLQATTIFDRNGM